MKNLSHIVESLRPLATPIDDLHLDPANGRTGHAVDRIAASLTRYGQRKPLVVNRNENNKIEAGNGTWQAAKSLGWQWIAAVFVEDDPMTAVGYGIADNRLGDLSEWDGETLQTLIDSLDPDLNLPTGFDKSELDELLAGLETAVSNSQDTEPQTSRAEELHQEWQTETGQLWVLPARDGKGEHRLIVGDCTDRAVVERVMGGDESTLGIHDPPYNVAQDTDLYAQNRSKALSDLANSEWDKGFDPLPALAAMKSALSKDSWCYVFTAHNLFGKILDWMNPVYAKTGFCVWCKPNPMPSLAKNTWTFGVELCLFGKNGKPTFNYPDGEHCLNWWPIAKSSDGTHPTQKTVEVIQHIVTYCSKAGDLITDFFAGSGTTLIACENLNRYCRSVEISPAYCAVILQRYLDTFQIRPYLAP